MSTRLQMLHFNENKNVGHSSSGADLYAGPFAGAFVPQSAVYTLHHMVEEPRIQRLCERVAALPRLRRVLLLGHFLSASHDQPSA